MADPLRTSEELVTEVTLGVEATTSLLHAIKGFRRAPSAIRKLANELQALAEVLRALETTLQSTDTDFSAIELPLRRCAQGCRGFEGVLFQHSGRSDSARANFQDWTKLMYLGSDINGFRDTIAGYKSTIFIARCNAEFVSQIPLETVEYYRERVSNTTYDLEDRFQDIDQKLNSLLLQDADDRKNDQSTCDQMEEEKEAILKCLEICNDVSNNIETLQTNVSQHSSSHTDSIDDASQISPSVLFIATHKLAGYGNKLEAKMERLNEKFRSHSDTSRDLASQIEQEDYQQEFDDRQYSTNIDGNAAKEDKRQRANVIETVTASDDAHQVMVSTIGHLIIARGVKAGLRSIQVFGQMSNESIQLIVPHSKGVGLRRHGSPGVPEGQFEERYGAGRNLHAELANESK